MLQTFFFFFDFTTTSPQLLIWLADRARLPLCCRLPIYVKHLFFFSNKRVFSVFHGFRRSLQSLTFICVKFKAIKSIKWYKKVLIIISICLKFGDGKSRIAIWLNVKIELQKALISLNNHEHCTFRSQMLLCLVYSCISAIPKARPVKRHFQQVSLLFLFRPKQNSMLFNWYNNWYTDIFSGCYISWKFIIL